MKSAAELPLEWFKVAIRIVSHPRPVSVENSEIDQSIILIVLIEIITIFEELKPLPQHGKD